MAVYKVWYLGTFRTQNQKHKTSKEKSQQNWSYLPVELQHHFKDFSHCLLQVLTDVRKKRQQLFQLQQEQFGYVSEAQE